MAEHSKGLRRMQSSMAKSDWGWGEPGHLEKDKHLRDFFKLNMRKAFRAIFGRVDYK